MATIRKRPSRKQGEGPSWEVRWDEKKVGKRYFRSKCFETQRDAKQFLSTLGVRTPSSSEPFKNLTGSFLVEYEKAVDLKQRERSTLRQLRQHISLHILTDLDFASLHCDEIETPDIQRFLNRLIARVSMAMARKIRTTLSQVFSFGVRNGFVSSNPVSESKLMLSSSPDIDDEAQKFTLPPKDDLRGLLETSKTFDNNGKTEAVIRLLMFAGLRSSELRGLRKVSLELDAPEPKVKVTQKADRYNKIGRVKAAASKREIGLGAETVKALTGWLGASPKSDYAFPTEEGNIWSYANLWHRFWVPLMNDAGLVTDEPASETVRQWSTAQRTFKQPQFGPHMLRHVYASLQIEQGVTPKRLQTLMGHSTLRLTMDTYGHLWPDNEGERQRAAAVEKAFG
jgi:integrase